MEKTGKVHYIKINFFSEDTIKKMRKGKPRYGKGYLVHTYLTRTHIQDISKP